MSNIFISGAASGLGLAFLRAYAAAKTSNTIYALDRSFPTDQTNVPGSAQVVRIECDITSETALSLAVQNTDLPELDLVIHCAGVRGLNAKIPVTAYSEVAGAETFQAVDAATLSRTLEINAVGAFLLLKALEPHLRRSSGVKPPRVAVMGSRMGSIAHNSSQGGAYAYRASKAALNAIVKSFAVDVPAACWTIIHPGRVETGLLAIREDDAMDVDEVVGRDLVPLIEGLEMKDSGRFVDRFGDDIPW